MGFTPSLCRRATLLRGLQRKLLRKPRALHDKLSVQIEQLGAFDPSA